MPLTKSVINFLGTDAPTDDDWNQKVEEMLSRNDTLETENQGLLEEKKELQGSVEELEELKPSAELGDKYLADTREAALVAYKKARGDEASEAMEKTIQSAGLEEAKALKEEFEAEVEKKFPLKCEACGVIASLSRRSSVEGDPESEGESFDESEYKLEDKKEE